MSKDEAGVDMSASAITQRLRQASAATNLSPKTRLETKINMSAEAILERLREVSELLHVCRTLATPQPEHELKQSCES